MKKLFTIVMVCALLSSCGSDEKKVEGNVGNIKGDWLIEEAMGKSTSGGEKEAFISFGEDGKFNGNTTVNSGTGEQRLSAPQMSAPERKHRQPECPEEIAEKVSRLSGIPSLWKAPAHPFAENSEWDSPEQR